MYDCSSPGLPTEYDILTDIVGETRTRVQFNPVDMVDPLEVRGAWPSKSPPSMNQSDYDVWLKRVEEWHSDLSRNLPGRITDTTLFRRSLLDEEMSGVGSPNTEANIAPGIGRPLKTATEEHNTRHCDMMQDWWPDHYKYPMAYHPTAPCSKSDTSYKTFDRSFTYYDDGTTHHKMVYEPLSMRDMDYVHTHFGAEGLCRTSNVELDMQVCFKCLRHR